MNMKSPPNHKTFSSLEPAPRQRVVVSMLDLPRDVLRRIAIFLPPVDALHTSQTCRTLLGTVRLVVLDPIALFEKVELRDNPWHGDVPLPGSHLALATPGYVHAACVTLSWVDQGWGNCKGQVYVVATPWPPSPPTPSTSPADQPWRGGRLVCESPVAEHTKTDLRLEFPTREGERYRLWYKAGGGGGHTLTLEHARLSFLVFDEADGSVRDTHRTLLLAGALPGLPPSGVGSLGMSRPSRSVVAPPPHRDPARMMRVTPTPVPSSLYPRLLLTVCQALRRQWSRGEAGDTDMMALLAEYGIQPTDRALRAVEKLLRVAQDERDRIAAEDAGDDRPPVPRPPERPGVVGFEAFVDDGANIDEDPWPDENEALDVAVDDQDLA